MITEEQLEALQKFIAVNYKPENGAKTPLWSVGNSDDVFYDGFDRGECVTLFAVAKLIGMNVKGPDMQDLGW